MGSVGDGGMLLEMMVEGKGLPFAVLMSGSLREAFDSMIALVQFFTKKLLGNYHACRPCAQLTLLVPLTERCGCWEYQYLG